MGITRVAVLLTLPGILLWSAPRPQEKKKKQDDKTPGAVVTVTAEATMVETVKTPNPVVVIPLEAIQQEGARDLGELLGQYLPGQVSTYGSPGMSTGLSIGGTKATQSVVLIDGLRFKDPSNTLGTDFSAFGSAGIDQVEILQGAASTLYGSDAHGGVVSLLSSQPSEKGVSASISLRGGNQGVGRAAFKGAYGWNGGWATGAVESGREHLAISLPHNYRKFSAHMGAGFNIGEEGLLQMNYRNSFQGAPLPFQWVGNKRQIDPENQSRNRIETFQMGYRHLVGSDLLLNANIGQCETRRTYTITPIVKNTPHVFGRLQQALVNITYMPANWSISVVADGSMDDFWKASPSDKWIGRHLAMAVEGTYEPSAEFRMVGSCRQQWDRTNHKKNEIHQLEKDSDAAVWKLGVNYRTTGGFRVYGSVGTAFNVPMTSQYGYNEEPGEPQLDNEKSTSYLFGGDWQNDRLFARVEAYRTDFSDMIEWTRGPSGAMTDGYYQNKKEARLQGIEFNVGHKEDRWSVDSFVRLQEARDLSLPKERQLQGLPDRPFNVIGVRGHQKWGSVRFDANIWRTGHSYASNYKDMGGSGTKIVPYKQHYIDASFSVSYQRDAHLNISLKGEHLFQNPMNAQDWINGADIGKNNVALRPGYPSQTRTFTLGATWKL